MSSIFPTTKTIVHGNATLAYDDVSQGPALFVLASLGRGPADYDHLTELLMAQGMRVLRSHPRLPGQACEVNVFSATQSAAAATALPDCALHAGAARGLLARGAAGDWLL